MSTTEYPICLILILHYFYAKNPREAKEKINSCSKEQWVKMSKKCRDWYNKNCSIEGSSSTTLKILNEQTLISNC
jgi:hypothetical protein